MKVDFSSPANSGILHHLRDNASSPNGVSVARSKEDCSPESVDDPYSNLGSHPDLVSWFWDEISVKLPVVCKWVVYGAPVLVNPKTGIIFGFAGGTLTYALRLPPAEREAAIKAGCKRTWNYPAFPELKIKASQLKLDEFGEEWVFGQFQAREKEWCLAAYEFAEHRNDCALN
jgi:hypothetical protein